MSETVLEITALRKSFGSTEVLKGIDLSVSRGDVIGLIGASGSGKSTFLRCINCLEDRSSGTILLNGETVSDRTRKDRLRLRTQRRRMTMVFQNFNLWPHRSALDNVIEGLTVVQGMPRREAQDKGRAMLERVGLADKAGNYPPHLSGGQQQRVAIARALALEPTLILFDEPTSALDPELVGEVLRVLRKLAEEGMTMIVVTHEMGFARDVCSKVLYLENGLVADRGSPEHVFAPGNARTSRFLGRYHAQVPQES